MLRSRTILALAALFFGCATSVRAETVTLMDMGRAVTADRGVYVANRDMFRRGGHGWAWKSPKPYGDGNSYGEARLSFRIGDVLPAHGALMSATLNWQFSNLRAVTYFDRPTRNNPFNPNSAHAPRVHGSNLPCANPMPCNPATIDRFVPQAAFWAGHITLDGVGTYWVPLSEHRNPFGSINLLDLWSAEELRGHTLSFFFTAYYDMGRPFFRSEGWNARTEFDVFGQSSVDALARLTVNFTAPTPQPASAVPEPATMLLFGSGLVGIAAGVRRRRHPTRTR